MRTVTLSFLCLLVALTPAAGAGESKTIESFQGHALMTTGGGSSVATINIYRWSSDEERAEIIDAIKAATDEAGHNDRGVAQALRGLDRAGYASFAGKQGYPLRYARSFLIEDGSRTIILATDRPVSFQEAYAHSQLGDFDVTLVVLKLDADGKGKGILSVGTEVKWDNETDKLDVTNVTSQPIKLTGIRKLD